MSLMPTDADKAYSRGLGTAFRMATEARLAEAKDWLVIVESLLKHKKDLTALRVKTECRQRVADLKLEAKRQGKGDSE